MSNGRSILVVDDDKSVLSSMKLLLKFMKYDVEVADSVSAASSILSTSKKFSLVICDYNLGNERPEDLIKKHPNNKYLVMSGDPSVRVKHYKTVAKTADMPQLKKAIDGAIREDINEAVVNILRGITLREVVTTLMG